MAKKSKGWELTDMEIISVTQKISVRVEIEIVRKIDELVNKARYEKNENIPHNRSQWVLRAIMRALEEDGE